MMSLEAIRRLNNRIAATAAEMERAPYVPFSAEEVAVWPPIPFPNFGHYEPDGWEQTEVWFVDKTGWGHPREPALTVEQFKRELERYIAKHPGHGFGITEEGQCQVYVSAFRPIKE